MGRIKQQLNRQRHDFLLTFFSKEPKREIKEVNGFWLEKRLNGNTDLWEVGIYTKESMKNYLKYQPKQEGLEL